MRRATELRFSRRSSPRRRGFRLRLGAGRLGRQPDSRRGDDPQDGRELRIAVLAEGLVEPLPRHAGGLGNLAHALRPGDEVEGVADLGGITVGEHEVEILRSGGRRTEVLSGIECLELADFILNPPMSPRGPGPLAWVRLSPSDRPEHPLACAGDPCYFAGMTDATTRAMPSALPPSEAELAEWRALSREEQLARYREVLQHPDCQRITSSTMSDIRAEAQRRVAARRG